MMRMILVNTTRTRALWERNGNVYVASVNGAKDFDGWPMDARWECSIGHFRMFEHLWVCEGWMSPDFALAEIAQ